MSSAYWIVVQAVYFLIVAVMFLMIFPIANYYLYQIWSLRKEPFFQKRLPTLTIICVFTVQLTVLVLVVSALNKIVASIDLGNASHYWYAYGSQTSYICYMLRVWYMYYDYIHGLQLISQEWKCKININGNNDNSHWTFNHKWLSHRSNVLYYIAISWLILDNAIFVYVLYHNENILWTAPFMAIDCLIGITIAFQVRLCRDELFIRTEYKYLGLCGIAIIISHIIITIAFQNIAEIQALVRIIVYSPLITFALYVSTKWLIDKYTERNMVNLINIQNKKQKIKLLDALKNEDLFDLFAFHLVKEFAIENLLFLYESMYFKNECVVNGLIKVNDIGLVLEFGNKTNVDFAVNLSNDIKSFYKNAEYIIDRYINTGSEFSVNISSSTRKNIQSGILDYHNRPPQSPDAIPVGVTEIMTEIPSSSDMSNKSDDIEIIFEDGSEIILKFIALIDEAMDEIIQLLASDSFIRFCQTKQFIQIHVNQ